jgi:hypothetical protein
MYPAILLLGISPKRIEIRVSKKYCDECWTGSYKILCYPSQCLYAHCSPHTSHDGHTGQTHAISDNTYTSRFQTPQTPLSMRACADDTWPENTNHAHTYSSHPANSDHILWSRTVPQKGTEPCLCELGSWGILLLSQSRGGTGMKYTKEMWVLSASSFTEGSRALHSCLCQPGESRPREARRIWCAEELLDTLTSKTLTRLGLAEWLKAQVVARLPSTHEFKPQYHQKRKHERVDLFTWICWKCTKNLMWLLIVKYRELFLWKNDLKLQFKCLSKS